MIRKVLISGGGIAGLAAAWWLERAGVDVIVVERAHAFEPVGHYITLKSHGVHVVDRMGLLPACRERELVFDELQAFTPGGRLLRGIDQAGLSRRVEGTVLFRRADLHAALHEAVGRGTDVRFASEVDAVRDVGDAVEVDVGGRTERVDLVLGADGLHSKARRVVFGDGGVSPLGGMYVAISVDYPHGLPPRAGATFWGRGQFVALFPRTERCVSAVVYHGDGGVEPHGRDPMSLRAFLLEAYAGFAPEVRRTFEAIDPRSFVFADRIAMVTLPRITRGRVALVGDAAHCPTFMSGMGASLALQGAEALARALAREPDDLPAALASYERTITGVADGYQESARKMRRIMLDRAPLVAATRDAFMRWTPEWVIGLGARRFYHANESMA